MRVALLTASMRRRRRRHDQQQGSGGGGHAAVHRSSCRTARQPACAGQIPAEVIDDVARVVLDAVDEGRLAPAQHRQAQRVHPGRLDHAAVVAQLALLVQHRHVQPAVVGTEPGRPHDADESPPPRRSSCSGDAAGTRVGSKRSGAPTSASRPVARAHSSKVSSRRSIFRSASANRLRRPPENSARPSRMAESRPTSATPIALSALRSSVDRSGVPTSCGDGSRRARVRSSISS